MKGAAFALALASMFSELALAQTAQDTASFYKTHTVRFIAGGGPGGGYDNYARLLAPHLAAALGTTVIVDNQPSAGGLAALNHIVATDTEGLQFIIMNGGGAVLSQLFNLPTVQYDLAKVNILGTVSSSPWLVLVKPDSPHASMADVVKAGGVLRWPATGPIDGLSDGASMMCEATSANNYIKSGQSKAIAVVSKERTRFFPQMQTVFEGAALSPEQTWWLSARSEVDALGRIILASPKIPADRLAYLQSIVRKVLTDPALLAEGDKLERYIEFQDAEMTRKRITGLLSEVTGERKDRLKTVVMKKYLPGG